VTMTANVAHVFLTDAEWDSTLRAVHAALRPGGRLVLETRDPAVKARLKWNRERSYQRIVVPGVGGVQAWVELLGISGDLVSFRSTVVFESWCGVYLRLLAALSPPGRGDRLAGYRPLPCASLVPSLVVTVPLLTSSLVGCCHYRPGVRLSLVGL
jgi:hypothetical protein